MSRRESFLEPPTPAVSGVSRYLTRLWVNGYRNRSDSIITYLVLEADRIDRDHHKIQDKIVAALKLLTFREPHVLVQFWQPREVGKQRQLLTTEDQPFGLGLIDERLWSYRRDSERNLLAVDKNHDEENRNGNPAARVFSRGLPEWTSDLDSYTPEQFPQKECAIHCNLHGYLGLPVFSSNTRLCVGVLEVLTSAKYTSYAYEVQQIHKALEAVGLRTQQAFDPPFLNVPNECRQKDINKIYNFLKKLCDIHSLPLAQTWAVCEHCCFVSHEKVIRKSCSSFDTRCVGKVCMSRAALPYHVHDMRMWPFFKASTEQHMDSSCGFVGRALLSRGSCFCEDVTRLGEEEYPLVHNARMNGLTGCFVIFLHSVEANDDYVLEFYLPPDMKESIHVLNFVQTLKQHIEIASGFELGDSSFIQVVGPPNEGDISLNIDPAGTIQRASTATTNNNQLSIVTSDSVSMVLNAATTESASVSKQFTSKKLFTDIISHDLNFMGTRTNDNMISYPDVSMQKKSDNINDGGERSKQGSKRKADSLTMEEAVVKNVGRQLDQAARSLSVSESSLMLDLTSWPSPKHSKTSTNFTNINLSQKSWPKKTLQRPSNKRFHLYFVALLMVRVKRWSCLSKSHGFSGKWWSCGRHSYIPFVSNFIYQTTFLIVRLKRWRNKMSKRNAMHNSVIESKEKPKYTTDIINNVYSRVAESSLVHVSPEQTADNISDTKIVTVKATYKDDMIKFQFPTIPSLLELEREVLRRIKLKSKKLCLKYMDEEKDLILLACDADLQNLLRHTANGSTIKLIIQTADY